MTGSSPRWQWIVIALLVLCLDAALAEGTAMHITSGIAMICVAVAMIWLARPADGVSVPFFKKAWIIGQLYVMVAMYFSSWAQRPFSGPNGSGDGHDIELRDQDTKRVSNVL